MQRPEKGPLEIENLLRKSLMVPTVLSEAEEGRDLPLQLQIRESLVVVSSKTAQETCPGKEHYVTLLRPALPILMTLLAMTSRPR